MINFILFNYINCYNSVNKWIMEVFMVIGSRIKEERLKRGLSQQQLGDLLDVTKVSVCGYENGTRTPTMETFMKLIEVLDMSPDYLLGRVDEPKYFK